MQKRIRKVVIATAITALAIPAAAWAADVTDFAAAETETETQNLAWYADHANDVNDQNETCREDLTEPVFVPEYDGRIIVKGQLTGAGLLDCLDLELESSAAISGRIWAESRVNYLAWDEFTSRNINGYLTGGVGSEEGILNYVYEYRSEHLGRPMRVCIQTFTPDPSPPLCVNVKTSIAAMDMPA